MVYIIPQREETKLPFPPGNADMNPKEYHLWATANKF